MQTQLTNMGTPIQTIDRPMVPFRESPYAQHIPERRVPYRTVKRLLDIVVSAGALIVLMPVMLAIAMMIKIESPGPIIFKQIRIGRRGRPFIFYKFRSMRVNAQELRQLIEHMNEQAGPIFKIRRDPRVTKVGQFIRKFSLDELPQLINVLKGDMSVVGPRPMTPVDLNQCDPQYYWRLAVPPGCTGLWQVSGRSNLTFDEWMRLDMYYVDNMSLWMDVKILLMTVPAVLRGEGAY